MLPLLPYSLSFLALSVGTGCLAISSSNWVFCLAGMALNAAVMSPNMVHLSLYTLKTGEPAAKYYLVQTKGTMIYSMGSAVFWHWDNPIATFWDMSPHEWGLAFIITGMALKIGLFPFYAWVPGVLLGLNWLCCWFVLTWQKFFPLCVLLQATYSPQFIFSGPIILMIVFTALVGGFLGLGQTNLRSLIGYSSMVHTSWSLMAAILGIPSLVAYLSIYACTLGTSVLFFSWTSARSVQSPLFFTSSGSSASPSLMLVSILSLAGMPPFLGFVGKWIVASQWTSNSMSLLPLSVALFSSFLSLNFYLSIFWGSMWRFNSGPSLLGNSSSFKSAAIPTLLLHIVPTLVLIPLLNK